MSKCREGCTCLRHTNAARGPNPKKGQKGSAHHQWTGDDATRVALHRRIKEARGVAANHSCVDCGGTAKDWSQKHGTTGLDIHEHYEPRCRSCHMKYDFAGGDQGHSTGRKRILK